MCTATRAPPQALRSAFAAVMTAPPAAVADAVARLAARLRARAAAGEALDEHEALALRLDEQFPGGDVGVLSAFFLNLVRGGHQVPGTQYSGNDRETGEGLGG